MGYVCFENPGRVTRARACDLLPAGLVKFRNLVASKLSLCVFHFLSPPVFFWENSVEYLDVLLGIDHLVLMA